MSNKPKSATAKPKAKKSEKERLDRELEEGLKETFPASDAVAVTEPNGGDDAKKK